MPTAQYGTQAFSSLNVGDAPHLIADNELTQSEDGWTEQSGAWTTAPGSDFQYSGTSITAMAAGRMGGADHVVHVDGTTLYDNGSSAGTVASGIVRIKPLDDGFLLLGASKAYFYDGDHIRELGCWQPTYLSFKLGTFAWSDQNLHDGVTAVAITQANPCKITCGDHGLDTGDWVYLENIGGMTQLNGRKFKATRVDDDNFTINEDSTSYTAYSADNSGTYNRKSGLTGTYKFYVTTFVELTDGTILESRPRGVRTDYDTEWGEGDSWEAEAITLSPNLGVYIGGGSNTSMVKWIEDSTNVFSITGTRGTDYVPGMRVYRTKAGGTEMYLEREWRHGDDDFSYVAGGATSAVYYPNHTTSAYRGFLAGPLDIDLGAVYLPGINAHDNPPDPALAAHVAGRLICNDPDNPRRVHWSGLDGIEFFGTFDWTPLGDTLTAIAQLGDSAVLFAGDRMWDLSFPGNEPYLREIPTPVGTTTPDAVATTDQGVMFLRGDGLWLYNGAQVAPISDKAFASIVGPATLASTGLLVYLAGTSKAYVARLVNGRWEWHESANVYTQSSGSGEYIYGMTSTAVDKLFAGTKQGGTMTTKSWVSDEAWRTRAVWVDVEGPGVPSVYINGELSSDSQPRQGAPSTSSGRRVIRVPVKQVVNHVLSVTIEATGDLTVYRLAPEVER